MTVFVKLNNPPPLTRFERFSDTAFFLNFITNFCDASPYIPKIFLGASPPDPQKFPGSSTTTYPKGISHGIHPHTLQTFSRNYNLKKYEGIEQQLDVCISKQLTQTLNLIFPKYFPKKVFRHRFVRGGFFNLTTTVRLLTSITHDRNPLEKE